MSALKTEKTIEEVKLDVNEDPTPEQLAAIDFSAKPKELLDLDKAITAAAEAAKPDPNNPFKDLYVLMFKGEGPIESIFFSSNRPPALIQRDCQIWCNTRSYRYIKYKKAYVNILSPQEDIIGGPPAGDISDIVTRQSRQVNFNVPEMMRK